MVYVRFVKPLLDKILATLLLLITLPILLVSILVLLVANRGKVWFLQQRPGYNERVFTLIKFKTMTDDRGDDGKPLSDAHRLTAIGKIIRKTSIDELPQLLNVVIGDMSMVGPRPLLMEYLPLYSATQRQRHQVRPGITGWAQVKGRNSVAWSKRFELDLWYVNNVSFTLDARIIFMTIGKIFMAEGVNSPGSATMEKFKGNG